MMLGNSPITVMNHYIISSNRNYDACDIADCAVNGYIVKTNNSISIELIWVEWSNI